MSVQRKNNVIVTGFSVDGSEYARSVKKAGRGSYRCL